jgi:hypothetical protein
MEKGNTKNNENLDNNINSIEIYPESKLKEAEIAESEAKAVNNIQEIKAMINLEDKFKRDNVAFIKEEEKPKSFMKKSHEIFSDYVNNTIKSINFLKYS